MRQDGSRRKLIPSDHSQALRLRLTFYALLGGMTHLFLVWLCLYFGFFRGGLKVFLILASADLLGRLTFLALVATGINLRFKEPGLVLVQMVWATLCVLAAIYFVEYGRLVLLMFYLQVMLFGAFRLRREGFIFVTALAVLGYAGVIIALTAYHPLNLNPRLEWLQWLGFLLIMCNLSLVGAQLNKFLRRYRRQNYQLKEAMDRIEELAITDELTKLFNRRYVIEILNEQMALAARGVSSFSVCYMDLDHFKVINDTLGHDAGDKVLKRTSELLAASLREVDRVARFGGEEFLAVLINSTVERSRDVAERLRRRIEQESFPELDGDLKVTISIGVAEYQPNETVDEVLKRADQALYQAKRTGRNRTVTIPA
ncbi:MAG: GGDEF domain-containing protein [Desulfarculaceae bacterium]|nr:GGDEF domain-containing protein [Desulfarculaceae bacterium]MCF8073396.1 GGDEF domain-containing protein [Desulfarculaceae bacterium]MCF8103494.1 GGDEF domain-containing protein [Desulfarculaceae bacterium]MCF8115807.1 GGDEF domain-containing protein [Desulfarculaceae bacterium]